MTRFRIPAVAALSAALLTGGLLSAAPASAYVGADSTVTTSSNNNANFVRTVTTLQMGVANGDGTRGVAWNCEGLSSGVSTTMYGCNLYVNDTLTTKGPVLSLPGPAVASGLLNIAVPQGATVYACGGTSAVFVDTEVLGARKCTDPVIVPIV
jgi:hypothetical protein